MPQEQVPVPASTDAPYDPTWMRSPPTRVPLPGPAIELARGAYHGCAVLGDRSVVCWGQNAWGQLTDGPLDGVVVRAALQTGLAIHADGIDATDEATCVIGRGEVACWGMIDFLGERRCRATLCQSPECGMMNPQSTPILPAPCRPAPWVVPGLADARFVSVSARRACAISGTNDLLCWDAEDPVATVVAHDIVAIEMDGGGCVIDTTGQVSCWGLRIEGFTFPDTPPGIPVAHIVGDHVEGG